MFVNPELRVFSVFTSTYATGTAINFKTVINFKVLLRYNNFTIVRK